MYTINADDTETKTITEETVYLEGLDDIQPVVKRTNVTMRWVGLRHIDYLYPDGQPVKFHEPITHTTYEAAKNSLIQKLKTRLDAELDTAHEAMREITRLQETIAALEAENAIQ